MLAVYILVAVLAVILLVCASNYRRHNEIFKTKTIPAIRELRSQAADPIDPLEAITRFTAYQWQWFRAYYRHKSSFDLPGYENDLTVMLEKQIMGLILDAQDDRAAFTKLHQLVRFDSARNFQTWPNGITNVYYQSKAVAEQSVQLIPAEAYNKLVGKYVARPLYVDYIWPRGQYDAGELRLNAAAAVLSSDISASKMILAYADYRTGLRAEIGETFLSGMARVIVSAEQRVAAAEPIAQTEAS